MSANADATINLYANDEASGTIRGASQGIKSDLETVKGSLYTNSDAWKAQNAVVRDTIRQKSLSRRSFQLEHQTFFESTKLLGKVGQAGMKVNSIFLTMNTMQIRKNQLDKEYRDSLKAQNEALLQSGSDSDEYRAAVERTAEAQQALNQLALETPGQVLGMGMAFVGLAGDIGNVVSAFKELTFHARGARSAMAITSAAGAASNLEGGIAGAAGAGASSLGGKLKSFAGSKTGQVLLPIVAGAATYEALTETDEGKFVNQNFNPFTQLFNGIFGLTHSSGEIAQATQQRDEALGGNYGIMSLFDGTFGQTPQSPQTPQTVITYNNYNGMEQEQIDRMKRSSEDSSVYD